MERTRSPAIRYNVQEPVKQFWRLRHEENVCSMLLLLYVILTWLLCLLYFYGVTRLPRDLEVGVEVSEPQVKTHNI
jgi:hypothetical protein